MNFLFAFLLSLPAFACKPAPLATCERAEILLRKPAFEKLHSNVQEYQKLLSEAIMASDKASTSAAGSNGNSSKIIPLKNHKEAIQRTSCFNNQFASFYLDQIGQFAKKRKNYICHFHLDFIDAQVKQLIDEKTLERKSVTLDSSKKELNDLAAKVKIALDEFQGEHSK